MNLELGGKVALVTAASRGMGRASAIALAAEGARVSIVSRDNVALEIVADFIKSAGYYKPLVVSADLNTRDGIDKAIDETVTRLGGVDILIANSIGPEPGGFEEMSDDAWADAFGKTILSTVRLVRGVIPSMKGRGGGSVVAIQSTSVRQPLPDHVLSNATRPGMPGLMKSLAMEYGRQGIRFNTITPGRVLTDRLRDLEARRLRVGEQLADRLTEMGRELPIGRLGRPEEIADVVTWLSSARASYVTGATIAVDGGNSKGLF